MEPLKIQYEIKLESGEVVDYAIRLDPSTLASLADSKETPPAWTRLEVGQCKDCPLEKETSPHCPIAVNLSRLVEHFEKYASFETVSCTVTTNERQYMKQVQLQHALFSIFGVIMPTSGCPVMDGLRPMVRYHLPFATQEETMVRSVSMYLLRQYFEYKRGGQPDLDLKKLEAQYEGIQKVNVGMIDRIRTLITSGDADLNAIGVLHTFSTLLGLAIQRPLETWEYLFADTSPAMTGGPQR